MLSVAVSNDTTFAISTKKTLGQAVGLQLKQRLFLGISILSTILSIQTQLRQALLLAYLLGKVVK